MVWSATFGLESGYPHAPSSPLTEPFILMQDWS
ncbi:hypothetical protein [Azospirillum palustre]